METITPSLSRKQLVELSGGLALMALFTAGWVFIAEVALNNADHGAVAGGFGIIIVYFIISYVKLANMARALPKETSAEDEKAKYKNLAIIIAVEVLAVIATKIALGKTHHDNLVIPSFALITGLFFFPIGKLYNRTFYYFVGAWMCLMAVVGYGLVYQGVPAYWPNPVVGIGCALATVANGIRIIRMGGITTLEI